MHVVDISLKPSDLSQQMGAMRVWLDEHGIDPSTFSCRHTDEAMLIRVEFRPAHHAVAFAERFGGRIGRPLAAHSDEDLIQEILPADALVG